MSSEPRALFLLLRRMADMDRASGESTAYLSALRRRSSASAAEAIQGIWIDEHGMAHLPSMLALPDVDGGCRSVRILETTGIDGIWMLCWLEASPRTVSRAGLVTALLECFGHERTGAATHAARFVPVFARDTPQRRTRDEVRALESRFPGLVLPPVHLVGDGALPPPPAQPGAGGRA